MSNLRLTMELICSKSFNRFPSYKGQNLSNSYKSYLRSMWWGPSIVIWPHLLYLFPLLTLLQPQRPPWYPLNKLLPQGLWSCCCFCLNALSLERPSAHSLAFFLVLIQILLSRRGLPYLKLIISSYVHTLPFTLSCCTPRLAFIYLICIYFSY